MPDYSIAAEAGQSAFVKEILDMARAKSVEVVDEVDCNGHTALMLAAKKGDEKTVEVLLSCGAQVNLAGNSDKFTPLHFAAKYDHANVIKMPDLERID